MSPTFAPVCHPLEEPQRGDLCADNLPLPLGRVLMESHSNDSRDSGHHWRDPSFGHFTPHHRRPVLL